MSTTIEELVYSFAIRQFHRTPINNVQDLMCICSDFANEFLAQPLSSRLTAEEKERVRKEYGERLSYAAIYKKKLSNSVDAVGTQFQSQHYQFYVAQIKLLECIFGKDFFKKGE